MASKLPPKSVTAARATKSPRRASLPDSPASTPIIVPIERLRPTQVAVGMRSVAAKLKRLEERKRRHIERGLAERPIPAVCGPRGRLYIVDHHHLTLALIRRNVTQAAVKVICDYSQMSTREFWSAMQRLGYIYPFDERGRRVPLAHMPDSMTCLRSDPFRDLAWSVRKAGGYHKTRAPFSEFRWAEFFRASMPARLLEEDYDRAVQIALKRARSAAAAQLPGYVCG